MRSIDNPYLEWLGVQLTCWSSGRAQMTLLASPNLENRTRRVQGGVLCTLLDAAAGYAGLYAEEGQPQLESLTLSLTTNFIASGEGKVLVAEGSIERQGRSIYFARSEIWFDSSLLLATAIGTFKYLRTPATDPMLVLARTTSLHHVAQAVSIDPAVQHPLDESSAL